MRGDAGYCQKEKELKMARISFIQNLSYEYLGVMYLSSLLKSKGHEVDCFIEHGQGIDKLVKEVARFNPDIAGFSCTTGVHQWSLRVANQLKKIRPDVKVVFGGPHPTFFPEIIEESAIDMICRGEGEYALLELAHCLDERKNLSTIENLWVKKNGQIFRNDVRPLIENLDELPFPDRDLYVRKYPFLHKSQKVFMVGRGCPFSCAYCFNHAFKKLYHDKGRFVRYRSPENIIAEIKEVKARSPFRTVYFQDDTFGLEKNWSLEFLNRYRNNIDLAFICLLRADLVDEVFIRSLKSAGCQRAFFGIETGSQDLRTMILKKKVSDQQIFEAARLLRKYKIKFRTYNMLALPNETLEDAFQTVRLNIKIKTDYPWSSLFQPFPGTELTEFARERGLIDAHSSFKPSFFEKSLLLLPERKEIENLHRLFFYAVKFPFLFPFIKKAIKWNFGNFYNLFFLLGYLWSFKESERISFLETIQIGLGNFRNFLHANNCYSLRNKEEFVEE